MVSEQSFLYVCQEMVQSETLYFKLFIQVSIMCLYFVNTVVTCQLYSSTKLILICFQNIIFEKEACAPWFNTHMNVFMLKNLNFRQGKWYFEMKFWLWRIEVAIEQPLKSLYSHSLTTLRYACFWTAHRRHSENFHEKLKLAGALKGAPAAWKKELLQCCGSRGAVRSPTEITKKHAASAS
jgi:hypothetical protein